MNAFNAYFFQVAIIDKMLNIIYDGLYAQRNAFRAKAMDYRKDRKYGFCGQLLNAAYRLDRYASGLAPANDNFSEFHYAISNNFGVQAKNY